MHIAQSVSVCRYNPVGQKAAGANMQLTLALLTCAIPSAMIFLRYYMRYYTIYQLCAGLNYPVLIYIILTHICDSNYPNVN